MAPSAKVAQFYRTGYVRYAFNKEDQSANMTFSVLKTYDQISILRLYIR